MSDIEKFPLESMNISEEQKQKLKQLFPEVITEGDKIDWDKLRLTLGETVDVGKERFGMNWPGKADCFKIIQQPSLATLVPARDESVNFDTTENIFIEGDNLEVLKLLQKGYLGKIKLIYIDPPYNTGNDFIYPDNYSESLETYLAYTGQVDSEGRKFTTNTDTEGRFHSKWMNMMYPRLFLAKNLLKENGVIFISIDDNEVKNLRELCNEIFGEENTEQYIWDVREEGTMPKTAKNTVRKEHEYIIAAYKNSSFMRLNKYKSLKYSENEEWGNPDNDPRGPWMSANMSRGSGKGTGGSKSFIIKNPAGIEFDRDWSVTYEEYKLLLADNRIYFANDGRGVPRKKIFQNEMVESIQSSIFENLKSSQYGRNEIKSLLPDVDFEYPKPTPLIKRLIQISANNDDIVFDFFAGSCTTAHSTLDLCRDEEIRLKFICAQLPEPIEENSGEYRAGYRTIADIGKERIRQVIKKTEDERKQDTDMFSTEKRQLDLGFKVFKLVPSNFSTWNANVDKTAEAIGKQLELHIAHISESADQEAILYELLLKSGFELTTKIEKLEIEGKAVFSIAEGELLICLERKLTNELIKAMAERKPTRVICLDEGFQNNDQLKTNAALIMKSKGVVKFQTL